MRKLSAAIVFASSVGLSGCSLFDHPQPDAFTVVAETACVNMKVYSQDEDNKLSSALIVLPTGSPVVPAMLDYVRMRKEVTEENIACKGTTVGGALK